MKRIADFANDRIDMKQMVALTGGGSTTSGSSSEFTQNNACGDIFSTTWKDNDQFLRYDQKYYLCDIDCDGGLMATMPATKNELVNSSTMAMYGG
jgi:hypothetical protein